MKRIRNLILMIIVLLSVFSGSITTYANSNSRYYFFVPDGKSGELSDEGEYIPSWFDSGEDILVSLDILNNSCFVTANKADEENIYYVDVDNNVDSIFWSNGESYTSKSINIGLQYYDIGESKYYPDGLESFNNMIYVCDPDINVFTPIGIEHQVYAGEWYFYYGNGCYGVKNSESQLDCLRDDHNHIVRGDVDLDGDITIYDATYIQRSLAKLEQLEETQNQVADADSDGLVSVLDATQIQRLLAKLIDNF